MVVKLNKILNNSLNTKIIVNNINNDMYDEFSCTKNKGVIKFEKNVL